MTTSPVQIAYTPDRQHKRSPSLIAHATIRVIIGAARWCVMRLDATIDPSGRSLR